MERRQIRGYGTGMSNLVEVWGVKRRMGEVIPIPPILEVLQEGLFFFNKIKITFE